MVIDLGRGPGAGLSPAPDPAEPGPFMAASQRVAIDNPQTGDRLATDIYYPLGEQGSGPVVACCPALVFAHGVAAQPSHYAGWGQHLATWGYVAALPHLPNEHLEVRFNDIEHVFGYLEQENRAPTSVLYRMIDPARLGVMGHSTGGITAMMVGARDPRMRAVVLLDPADPYAAERMVAEWLRTRRRLPPRMTRGLALAGNRMFRRVARISGNAWDFQAEAGAISGPLLVMGGQPEACNVWGYYRFLYAAASPAHKALYMLPDGRHCDYMDTPDVRARNTGYLICLPPGRFSPARLGRIKRYTTAWLNYYLQGLATDFAYLYGDRARADVDGGLIEIYAQTAPRELAATALPGAVRLAWTSPHYPAIAGYNVYRHDPAVDDSEKLHAALTRTGEYLDQAVVPGHTYCYTVRSRDAAGNEHQPSAQVQARASAGATGILTEQRV